MFLFFSSFVLIALFVFFYSIGLWYLGFLPLFFFLFLFLSSPNVPFSSLFSRQIFRYSLFFAWIIILSALWGLVSYLGVPLPIIFLFSLILNLILWVLSLIFSYQDGKQIFPLWYWFSFSLFLIFWLFFFSFSQYFSFLLFLVSLQLALFWFILFVLRLFFPQVQSLVYHFLVSICVWLVLLLLVFVPNFVLALVLAWWLLTLLYFTLWWFYKQKPVEQKHISVRRILSGERLTTKKVFSSLLLAKISEFLHTMPQWFLSCLEYLNILLILALFWFFFWHWNTISDFTQLYYWVVVALFVTNTILLKKITTTNILQNLFLFLVLHFAVYVSFFSYFGSQVGPVVFWAIIWNLFTSIFLFYIERFIPQILTRLDYWYRLIAAMISFICNLLLLMLAPLPGELIFFFTLLYLGAEGVLLFYGVKYITSFHKD